MAKKTALAQETENEIPTEDTSNRFLEDRCLRAAGFRILERRKGQPALWMRDGQRYLHEVALKIVDGEIPF